MSSANGKLPANEKHEQKQIAEIITVNSPKRKTAQKQQICGGTSNE